MWTNLCLVSKSSLSTIYIRMFVGMNQMICYSHCLITGKFGSLVQNVRFRKLKLADFNLAARYSIDIDIIYTGIRNLVGGI